MSAARLCVWRSQQLRLPQAIQAAANMLTGPAVGIFYTPDWCRFGLYAAGKFLDERVVELPLEHVFEARIFSENVELRWLRDPGMPDVTGTAAFLSESNHGPDGWTDTPPEEVSILRNRYLLWGEFWNVPGLAPGWSCLASGRTRLLPVPVQGLQPGERAALCSVEYIGLAEGEAGVRHGNAVVLEERLIRVCRVKVSELRG